MDWDSLLEGTSSCQLWVFLRTGQRNEHWELFQVNPELHRVRSVSLEFWFCIYLRSDKNQNLCISYPVPKRLAPCGEARALQKTILSNCLLLTK